jgi:hypothetical protein
MAHSFLADQSEVIVEYGPTKFQTNCTNEPQRYANTQKKRSQIQKLQTGAR